MARHKLDVGDEPIDDLFKDGPIVARGKKARDNSGIIESGEYAGMPKSFSSKKKVRRAVEIHKEKSEEAPLTYSGDRDAFWSERYDDSGNRRYEFIDKDYLKNHPEDLFYGHNQVISGLKDGSEVIVPGLKDIKSKASDNAQARLKPYFDDIVEEMINDNDGANSSNGGEANGVSSGERYAAVAAKKGELPYQTWERATGLKWSEAKKRGYTTGRDQENLQLQRDLLAGNVSKQGGHSDERPEGYKNSKLGQGSYYLTKPKTTATAATQSKPTASTSVSGEIAANRDYVPGQKFNPYKTVSFSDGLGKNTKAALYGGGSGTGGGPAKLPTQPTKLSTQNSGKQTKTNTSVSKKVRSTNLDLVLQKKGLPTNTELTKKHIEATERIKRDKKLNYEINHGTKNILGKRPTKEILYKRNLSEKYPIYKSTYIF